MTEKETIVKTTEYEPPPVMFYVKATYFIPGYSTQGENPGKKLYGPFATYSSAERCAIALAGRGNVISADITQEP